MLLVLVLLYWWRHLSTTSELLGGLWSRVGEAMRLVLVYL
jgi:hypothetical protein